MAKAKTTELKQEQTKTAKKLATLDSELQSSQKIKSTELQDNSLDQQIQPLQQQSLYGLLPQPQLQLTQHQALFPQQHALFPQQQGLFPQQQGLLPQQHALFPQQQGLFPQQQGFFSSQYALFNQQPQYTFPSQFLYARQPLFYTPLTPFAPLSPPQALLPKVPTISTTATTERPSKKREREPTTAKPSLNINERLSAQTTRLVKKPQTTTDESDFRNDANLLAGVRQINPQFVIEDIVPVPGKHVLSMTISEQATGKPAKIASSAAFNQQPKVGKTPKKSAAKLLKGKNTNSGVKVEATGRTATTGNIPQIPFGTYFLPYLSQAQVATTGRTAALILEPHSKAVVGNGGTAISTPISRAVLRRGVPTNVYFNPESVAIAGVGGKAHAQADLELDLINRR